MLICDSTLPILFLLAIFFSCLSTADTYISSLDVFFEIQILGTIRPLNTSKYVSHTSVWLWPKWKSLLSFQSFTMPYTLCPPFPIHPYVWLATKVHQFILTFFSVYIFHLPSLLSLFFYSSLRTCCFLCTSGFCLIFLFTASQWIFINPKSSCHIPV